MNITLYALISFLQVSFLSFNFKFSLAFFTNHHAPNIFNKIVIKPREITDFPRSKFPVVIIVQSAKTLSPRNVIKSGMFIIIPMPDVNNLNTQSTHKALEREKKGEKLLKVGIFPSMHAYFYIYQ